MADLNKMYLYRMTHIDNVPHILQFGITHRNSPNRNPHFIPIGDRSLITTRNNFVLENGRQIGDYIPFYFGYRMPMLYVIQKGYNNLPVVPPEQIVYCVSSVAKMIEINLDFIFTNGHAVDSFSSCYSIRDIDKIDELLDINAIQDKYWKDDDDLDKKRRKEAEFLISEDVPSVAILGFVVYNEQAKVKLQTMGVDTAQIHISKKHYF